MSKPEPKQRWGLRNIQTDEVVKEMRCREAQTQIQKTRVDHVWIVLPEGFDQVKHLINSQGEMRGKLQ